jgi:hypothetical protein
VKEGREIFFSKQPPFYEIYTHFITIQMQKRFQHFCEMIGVIFPWWSPRSTDTEDTTLDRHQLLRKKDLGISREYWS